MGRRGKKIQKLLLIVRRKNKGVFYLKKEKEDNGRKSFDKCTKKTVRAARGKRNRRRVKAEKEGERTKGTYAGLGTPGR